MSALAIVPAQFYGQYIPSGSLADQRARTMNMRGLYWCLSMRGKFIGDGGCTRLADMHLAVSGAVPADFRDYRNTIWGAVPNGWAPGDVLQFEHCYFYWNNGSSWGDMAADHHTAIIVSLRGNVVELVHQNAPLGGPVAVTTLDLNTKQRGTIRGWRPVGG
jgi:hypothetical protein